MARPVTHPSTRVWDKFTIDDGCWEWVSAKNERGYGVMSWGRSKMVKAHRLMWEMYNDSDIPGGMVVMHTCDNRGCVRPDHLELGYQRDNLADMASKGRHWKQNAS